MSVLPVSIILATSVLALGYGLGGFWIPAILMLAMGSLWLLGRRTSCRWSASVMLILLVIAAAIGLRMDLEPALMLFGVVAALSAWDLDHFARRLTEAGRVEQEQALTRHHLRRLLIVDAVGLLLGAVALLIRVDLSFGVVLLLALLALLGLSRAISFLGRESDQSHRM